MRLANLTYNGSDLTAEPVNMTLATVIACLRANLPTLVVLEPGDCTRYELLLVPHPEDWRKLQSWNRDDVVLTVVRYVSGKPTEVWTINQHFGEWSLTNVRNEWARTFLSHWLKLVMERLV